MRFISNMLSFFIMGAKIVQGERNKKRIGSFLFPNRSLSSIFIKDSASRAENKTNPFVFYPEAQPIFDFFLH